MTDFDGITSTQEIARILKLAAATHAEVCCEWPAVASSGGAIAQIDLEIKSAQGSNIVLGLKREPGKPSAFLSSVMPALKIGDSIEIIFSLVDGQYAIRDVVTDVSLTAFTVNVSRQLLRLQRRRDFRVSVRGDGIVFEPQLDSTQSEESVMETDEAEGAKPALPLIDLSAGGMRLLWLPSFGGVPPLDTLLTGVLRLAEDKTPLIEAKLVKNHGVEPDSKSDQGVALSFQFENLSQSDARTILFTCLFVHRSHYGNR
ncbi:MAG: hypothetical protein RBT63_04640 [Bdellovibrionales bacterium]|jgi:hypothetical protein|nr:hypothetical protein [Bdellovibrionales bacterium]